MEPTLVEQIAREREGKGAPLENWEIPFVKVAESAANLAEFSTCFAGAMLEAGSRIIIEGVVYPIGVIGEYVGELTNSIRLEI